VHEAGIFGKGVKIAVVDTGIWYNHSALGGGFGPGFKVAGGYDLVGDGLWPYSNDKHIDADPNDQQGHGTHVAGIIAGKTESWTGVAPEAILYSYKVFTQSDGTDDATLIETFIAAYSDDVDIITASIGGYGGFANNAWAEVASRIVERGVVVTIATCNAGNAGAFFSGTGSSGKNVLAVASAEVTTVEEKARPSYFTSWGGLYDLTIKPDISAPGSNIFSTYFGPGDSFAELTGTSMATPYIAGVAALYISAHGGKKEHGKNFAQELAMRIIASGTAMPWLSDSSVPGGELSAPIPQVGNGLVDSVKLLNYKALLSFGRFALNDKVHFQSSQSITITNNGEENVTYSFSLQDSAEVEVFWPFQASDAAETPRLRKRVELIPSKMVPNVPFPTSFTLAPRGSQNAESATLSISFHFFHLILIEGRRKLTQFEGLCFQFQRD